MNPSSLIAPSLDGARKEICVAKDLSSCASHGVDRDCIARLAQFLFDVGDVALQLADGVQDVRWESIAAPIKVSFKYRFSSSKFICDFVNPGLIETDERLTRPIQKLGAIALQANKCGVGIFGVPVGELNCPMFLIGRAPFNCSDLFLDAYPGQPACGKGKHPANNTAPEASRKSNPGLIPTSDNWDAAPRGAQAQGKASGQEDSRVPTLGVFHLEKLHFPTQIVEGVACL